MKISPNVYWLDGQSSNMYLCVDDDGLTLVDTGMPKSLDLILDMVKTIGYEPGDLIRILITHADMDHAGSAAAVQAETNATIYSSQATAELLYTGKSAKHMPWPMQFILDHFVGYPSIPRSVIKICQDQDVLPILGGLRVMATPGHTADHHSFHSPTTGVLFAGDALRTVGGRLESSPKRMTLNPDAARHSAIQLLSLTPAVIACGHGEPMSQHSNDEIMELFSELRSS